MTTRQTFRLVGGIIVGLALAYVVTVMGLRWWLSYKDPDIHIGVVPMKNQKHVVSSNTENWVRRTFGVVTFSVPPDWRHIQTTQKSTVWGTNSIKMMLRAPGVLPVQRYRRSLYATWNILGLLDRDLFIPPLDKENPKIIEQMIGPWHAFVFPTSARWWFDLFQDSQHVSVTFAFSPETETMTDSELEHFIRDIVATIEVHT